jgi:multiple sugar transport system substrate-binding protein
MTWMPWSAHNQWLTPTYEQVAAGFSEQHPQTRLTLLPVPDGWLAKLKTMIAAGTPPDVSDVHHGGQVRDLGPSGQVIDLSPFLKRDAYPKSYVGWEPYRWLHKQYGVPWALQSTAIFYNKALFDQAGVAYPSDRWTWDDFVDAARRLTKPGVDANSTIWGAADQGGRNYQWVNALLATFGGAILKADYTECVLTATAALAGLEFRAAWGPKLGIAPNQPGGASGQFTNGTIAMATSGSWFVANVKRNTNSRLLTANVPWDVAPVPRGRVRRAALAHELGVGIPAGVRHVDASWAAVRYLTSQAALRPFGRIGRIIPPERSLWPDAAPADGAPASFKRAFVDVWDEITIEPPFVPRWPDVEAAWQEELDKVWTGERPVKDGAAAFKSRMDQHLQQLKRDGLL